MTRIALVMLTAGLMVCGSPAFAGSVSGVVLDQGGAPMAGVHVEVVYQTYRADDLNAAGASIKATTVSDVDGRYSMSTDHLPPGEYVANAYELTVNGGQETIIALTADDATGFAGNAETVRNFTGGIVEMSEDLPYGNAGVFVLNNDIGDFTDLSAAVVTLRNVETGQMLVKPVRSTGEGLAATGIPFGTYEVSVALDGAPLRVKLWAPDAPPEFGATVTHDFSMGWTGNQLQVAARP